MKPQRQLHAEGKNRIGQGPVKTVRVDLKVRHNIDGNIRA